MDATITMMNQVWENLYPETGTEVLNKFISKLKQLRSSITFAPHEEGWYKDAVVYSLYIDLFNKDFPGLEEKLDYLQDLGINCLWLLPILDSPGKGFDIKDYRSIRPDLLGLASDTPNEKKASVFANFLGKAHSRGIKVIFDIAINHSSEEHLWFQESRKSVDNPYRDYYIWADDNKGYEDARIIFKGLCESNWEKDGSHYFFHRFFYYLRG